MDGFQSNYSDLQVSFILCMNSHTISWCQWVLVGGENDCHLCRYVSCTFLHLTADCDGWEKTDPGDSLDAEEGEGCRHVYLCVTLRSWTNDSPNIQMNLDLGTSLSFTFILWWFQAFSFEKVKVWLVCFFDRYKYFTWWKYGREKREMKWDCGLWPGPVQSTVTGSKLRSETLLSWRTVSLLAPGPWLHHGQGRQVWIHCTLGQSGPRARSLESRYPCLYFNNPHGYSFN